MQDGNDMQQQLSVENPDISLLALKKNNHKNSSNIRVVDKRSNRVEFEP